MAENSATCVVHLVREKNGIGPFNNFIESYRMHKAGIEHELLIVFKGFQDDASSREYRELLSGLNYRSLWVEDTGFDIGPYFRAARDNSFRYFCFLNSFSVILDDGWLAKMCRHIQREGIGIVGATGSYESIYTTLRHSFMAPQQSGLWKSLRDNLVNVIHLAKSFHFPSFPNYHVRTNAFLVSREIMLRLKPGALRTKLDLYRFESGRNSMTRQILSFNLRALIIGRDGLAYEKERWRESCTFRSGRQKNLLVADNQTRLYASADAQTRKLLFENTWGLPAASSEM